MTIATWHSAAGGEEFALSFDRGRPRRLLILPPLFDEANKTRRLLAEVMRRLDGAEIDSFLPDLPGCNESLAPLESQTLASWRREAEAAAAHFGATNLLAVRAAAVIAPWSIAGWRYAPLAGSSALRTLLRARTISAREAGRDETADGLTEIGLEEGLELAGYQLGPAMIRELSTAQLPDNGRLRDIEHSTIGGSAPWLRAEPGYDPAQADALAAFLSIGLSA